MNFVQNFYESLPRFIPLLAVMVFTIGVVTIVQWIMRRRAFSSSGSRFRYQAMSVLLTIVGILLVILTLPVSEETRGDLLSLVGIALTAIVALSASTVVANAMAGLMLRLVRSFRTGDFVRVGEWFRRVSDRGLFHTEIQTEDSDLTTLPNTYLVTNPVTVVRSTGTIVSATVSLGYGIHHATIESALLEAAKATELEKPFVQVRDLADWSVTYRVAGFLSEVKQLVSARSALRVNMLDQLHEAGVEIVSPSFMYQRQQPEGTRMVPPTGLGATDAAAASTLAEPEDIVFDKAQKAEDIEQLRSERSELTESIKELEGRLDRSEGQEKDKLDRELSNQRRRKESIERFLKSVDNDEKD
jgi:small-conductance mechanosensitive channel